MCWVRQARCYHNQNTLKPEGRRARRAEGAEGVERLSLDSVLHASPRAAQSSLTHRPRIRDVYLDFGRYLVGMLRYVMRAQEQPNPPADSSRIFAYTWRMRKVVMRAQGQPNPSRPSQPPPSADQAVNLDFGRDAEVFYASPETAQPPLTLCTARRLEPYIWILVGTW